MIYFFYKLFSKYDYLLTYELDAYVFRDELLKWCKSGYDYIGAPWAEGWDRPVKPLMFIGVGNSGFSLRNVQVCSLILKRINKLKIINNLYLKFNLHMIIPFSNFLRDSNLYKMFRIRDTEGVNKITSNAYINEDGFWALWIANTFIDFIVAPVDEAIKFSFEVDPQELYNLTNRQLPFGCHAWLKYDFKFWRNFINTT